MAKKDEILESDPVSNIYEFIWIELLWDFEILFLAEIFEFR